MKEFIDRVPDTNMANRMTIEYADGTSEQVKIISADNATEVGTPINRANLMAIQGFVAKTTTVTSNSIIETNGSGETLTTVFNTDGSITQTFKGKYTLTKKTTFNSDGSIKEVIS